MKTIYNTTSKVLLLLLLLTAKLNAQVVNNESFDNALFVPTDWTDLLISGGNSWSRVTAGTFPTQSPHSGAGEAYFNSWSVNGGVRALVTPGFPLTANTSGASVSFWMYRDNGYNTTPDKIDVYYNTSVSMTGASLLGTVNRAIGLNPVVGTSGWYQYTYSIPASVTNPTVYIIFQATSAYGNNIYLDDISWTSYPVPCTTAPGSNTVIAPSYSVCPNTSAYLSLAAGYTVSGITYQWQSSTSSPVGPFTAIPNATNSTYSAPNMNTSTYYTALITCTNNSSSISAVVGTVGVSPTITDIVPYHEGFENIISTNYLPNCSWSASNLPGTCQTYTQSSTLGRMPHTGTKFASFYYSPGGTNYFYTNGIYLNAGVTYSAGLWFETEGYGYNNWTDLSILYGTTQTATGLVSIASTNGPAISNVYKTLSNTFTVPTSGLYYIAISATGNTSSFAEYLTWDDLSITIPCTLDSPNTPTLSASANNYTICQGNAVNLTASGCDTYTWSTGSNGASITDSPVFSTAYTVIGTNTLTGCTSMTTQSVFVNPAPAVYALASQASVCAGSHVDINAIGASSYTWSNGALGNVINVTPTSPTTYTVFGTNSFGCVNSATTSVSVYGLPNVTAASNMPNDICAGESATLSASGAISFVWMSSLSSNLEQGTSIIITPGTTVVYTVTGTDINGCKKSSTVTQNVNECTGLKTNLLANGMKLYPNPTQGEFTLEMNNTLTKTILVTDLSGRIVVSATSTLEKITLNIANLSSGVYYVKIQSDNSSEVIKLVKQD